VGEGQGSCQERREDTGGYFIDPWQAGFLYIMP